MARPISDDDEVLELPGELDPEDEVAGLPETEELALADISEGPEDVGLDTELGVHDAYEPGIDEDGDEAGLDDETLGEAVAVDAEGVDEGEEAGWLEESEGSPGAFDVEIDADDEEYEDDGGLEGVDDPMVDGLEDDAESSALEDDEEDEGDDLGEEMIRELEGEGVRSARR